MTATREELDHLEQQAADARIRAQRAAEELEVQQSAVEEERARRQLAFREQRFADYDRTKDGQDVRDAQGAFVRALMQDPVVTAFIAWQAAEQRAHLALHAAHSDALATIGRSPFGNLGTVGPMVKFLHDVVSREVEQAIADSVHEWFDERSRAETTAVLGDVPRTPEEQTRFEADQTEAERRRRAVISPNSSIDVTDMSEAERKQRALPPGRPAKR